MKKYEKDEPSKKAAEVSAFALEVQHQNSGISQNSAARQVEKVANDAALAKALADNEQELVNEKRRKELEEDEALAKKLQEELNKEANEAAAIEAVQPVQRNEQIEEEKHPGRQRQQPRQQQPLKKQPSNEQSVDQFNEDAETLQKLGMNKIEAFQAEWFPESFCRASLNYQIEYFKNQMIKSTFGGYGREQVPGEDDGLYAGYDPFGYGQAQKRPNFGAIGINNLQNLMPAPIPAPNFGLGLNMMEPQVNNGDDV